MSSYPRNTSEMASESPSPPIPSSDSDQYCLFVANLPQRMTNEELALSLLSIFKPFGTVQSVKASRDYRGRPFGFVEYADEHAASSALSYGPYLSLDGRRIRVEPAKKQRKLCIKWKIDCIPGKVEQSLEAMRNILQKWVKEEDFKLSLQTSQEAEDFLFGQDLDGQEVPDKQIVAAIVKFEDSQKAKEILRELQEEQPEWGFTWISMDRSAFGSNVRNSGLVQLVPGQDGSVFIPQPVFSLFSRYASPPPAPVSIVFDGPPSPISTRYIHPSFEEEVYQETPQASLEEWLGITLFVGRLNGQYVTIPLLKEKFSSYGTISFIRLYNRGVVGFDGVPLDAYAFIRFSDELGTPVSRAISTEHGKVWLGQAIKCEPARPAALSAMLTGQRVRSPPAPSLSPLQIGVPMTTVYYPGGWPRIFSPPPMESMLRSNQGSNWFRAKATSNGHVARESV